MLGELADQPLALVIDGLGQYDLENDEEIAVGLIARGRQSLSAQPELHPAGTAGRDRQRLQAARRRYVDLRAKHAFSGCDRNLDGEVTPIAT